jgi:hypothetical protein
VSPLELLGLCLGLDDSPPTRARIAARLAAPDLDDLLLMELANRHQVAPALAAALTAKGLDDALPEGAREYLAHLLALNRERNALIRRQVIEVVLAVRAAGVEPVLLKGAAFLFDGTCADPAERMLADIDLLVPETSLPTAVEAVLALGYDVQERERTWCYHFLPLVRRGEMAPIEFHHHVGEQRHLLDPASALATTVRLEAADAPPVSVLHPTEWVVHAVFHAELQDRARELGEVPLRTLLDVARLAARHGAAIDWVAARARLGPVLDEHLELAHRLLALPRPLPPCPAAIAAAGRRLAPRRIWQSELLDGWAELTKPLKRSKIDFLYHTEQRPWLRQLQRGRHVVRVALRYARKPFA